MKYYFNAIHIYLFHLMSISLVQFQHKNVYYRYVFGPTRYLFVFVDVDGSSSQGKTVTNKQVTYSVLNRGASLGV